MYVSMYTSYIFVFVSSVLLKYVVVVVLIYMFKVYVTTVLNLGCIFV